MDTDQPQGYKRVYDATVMGRIGEEIGPETAVALILKGNFEALIFEGMLMGLHDPAWAQQVITELESLDYLVNGHDVVAKGRTSAIDIVNRFKVFTDAEAEEYVKDAEAEVGRKVREVVERAKQAQEEAEHGNA